MALDKGDFIGRDALTKIKARGVTRKLVSYTVDGFAPFHGGEAVIYNGKVVGSTASTGYGYTLGKTIAFGYLPTDISAMKTSRSRPSARPIGRAAAPAPSMTPRWRG